MNDHYFLDEEVKNWLLMGDPSVVFLTNKYLLNTLDDKLLSLQEKAESGGWIKELLDLQEKNFTWSNRLYSPKWTSTHYTLLLLTRLEVNPNNIKCASAARLLLNEGFYEKTNCISYGKTKKGCDVCVTAMLLAMLSYFKIVDKKMEKMIDFFIKTQFKDGGWNCRLMDTHSSVHTTLSVLESFHEFKKISDYKRESIERMEKDGQEFLLSHRLFKSSKTGKVMNEKFKLLSFPPRWKYDILKAMEYFSNADVNYDERMGDAIKIIMKKKRNDNTWPMQNRHPGLVFFDIEKVGESSRINTFRVNRVLKKYFTEIKGLF